MSKARIAPVDWLARLKQGFGPQDGTGPGNIAANWGITVQFRKYMPKLEFAAPFLHPESLQLVRHYGSKTPSRLESGTHDRRHEFFGDNWMFNPMGKLAGGAALSLLATLMAPGAAQAAQPTPWQWWHQPAASPNMEAINSFDILTLWIIVPITLFVLGLLAYVMIRFRESAHPVPTKTTHNTTVEVVWTLGPILILIFLAIPSFQLLTAQFNPPKEPTVTIKATGYQWYWGFEYQDDAEISFETRPIGVPEIAGSVEAANAERVSAGKEDLSKYPRLLAVDNELVVPVGEVVRVLVTAGDVIHNFAMPAFGVKLDGYPGRLNETFFQATKEGLYYGQCSELCGKYHAYMPIAIRVVSEDDFDVWKDMAGDDVEAANKALMASLENKKKLAAVSGN